MIATQEIIVAVKNMANMKIFLKTSFKVAVFLQSERGSDFLNYHVIFELLALSILSIAHNYICNG